MEGREESKAQNTDTDPWTFPRRNRDHNSKWMGQGRTPGTVTVQEPRDYMEAKSPTSASLASGRPTLT